MSFEDILSYDHIDETLLFEGDATSKPNKSVLVAELKKHLTDNDCMYQPRSELKYIVIVDFMSQTRKLRLSDLKVISDIFQRVLSRIRTVCNADQYDIVYDSYLESSVNELERIRRVKLIAPIDFGHIRG